MSTPGTGFAGLPGLRGRDPHERGRVASTLELFFDLVFVIAVGRAADGLFDFYREGSIWQGVLGYLLIFFGIWWAWIGFAWFASAFDSDDWLYRTLTIVQMAGVLVLAAGVPAAMQHLDLRLGVAGYVVIRLAQVVQYLRAARDPRYRATERRYAAGITAVQVLWVLDLLVPRAFGGVTFVVLAALEMTVPAVAEYRGATPFHRHHIAERYGAFTLIVLGEGLLSVATALFTAFQHAEHLGQLALLGGAALVLVAGMWWIYFAREQHQRLSSFGPVFRFGYGHYAVFAAAGAVAAGIEAAIGMADGESSALPTAAVQATTTVPVAVFLVVVWLLALRPAVARTTSAVVLVLTALVALAALVPAGIAVAAVLVVGIVVALEIDVRRPRVDSQDA